MSGEGPTETIRIWKAAVRRLNKVERRLDGRRLTPETRTELLTALTEVDEAWDEHLVTLRAWATGD